ncbi:MAG: nitroreductase family protein, partial [Cryomorphaceae bacterium]
MTNEAFISLDHREFSPAEMHQRADAFFELMNRRRSVRAFSTRAIDRAVIDRIIQTASTAPSGAHKQPWTFCVVTNPELRTAIRKQAEHEERISYESRMSDKWLKDLEPLGTDAIKPY